MISFYRRIRSYLFGLRVDVGMKSGTIMRFRGVAEVEWKQASDTSFTLISLTRYWNANFEQVSFNLAEVEFIKWY